MQIKVFVGHRGSKGYGAENTREAFLGAVKKQNQYIETDVRVSRDGVAVLYHDADFYRLMEINNNVESMTYDALKDLIIKQTYNGQTFTGSIMRLDHFLDFCKEHKVGPLLDIKWTNGLNENSLTNVSSLIDLIREKNMIKETVIICSMRKVLEELVRLEPTLRLQYLVGASKPLAQDVIDFCFEHKMGIDLEVSLVTKDIIEQFHAKGLEVNTWVVNNKEKAEALFALGIDMITTDLL